jgi:hypothetical protein
VDGVLNARRILVMWRWENALQKQVLEHGDPEMGEHVAKASSGIGSLEMASAMSYYQTSLLLTSEIEEAIEEKDVDKQLVCTWIT